MVKSDSQGEENMDELELSDSIDPKKTKKRPRVVDSEDEAIDLKPKKEPDSTSQQNMSNNNDETVANKTDGENNQTQNESIKQENGNESFSNKDNSMDKTTTVEKNKENENSLSGEIAINISTSDKVKNKDIRVTGTESEEASHKEKEIKDKIKMEYISENRTVDTEVVEGLELSVECASEKDEPNIESENEDDVKPQLETIFTKAASHKLELKCSLSERKNPDSPETTKMSKTKSTKKTVDTEVVEGLELSVECASEKEEQSFESDNEEDVKPRLETIFTKASHKSELKCSSSEGQKLDSQEATNTSKTKSAKKKKRSSRTSSDKLKSTESDDNSSQDNSDENYSPQTKKTKLSTPKKSAKRSVVSRKGRNKDIQRKNTAVRKNTKSTSDDENPEAMSTSGEIKKEIKIKTEEEMSEKESSTSNAESNNNSVDEDTPVKRKRKRRSNVKPEDNSKIQNLKKYIKAAGIRVKCYNSLWADCNTNIERINRLKKLLEDNGITGRPTLEKCKLVKQKRERMQEVSELDTSNIISEGRVTRTRGKKMSSNTDTSTQHRETRNNFKRLLFVVDSDSE